MVYILSHINTVNKKQKNMRLIIAWILPKLATGIRRNSLSHQEIVPDNRSIGESNNSRINHLNLFFMKNFLFLAITLLITLGACQKEKEEISPVMDEASSSVTPVDSLSTDMNLKISSSSILNATSASQIPSRFFQVNPIYKTTYIHLKQYSGECSWTSYVLCTGAIARANGKSYPATHSKVTSVKNACNNSAYIGTLSNYAGNYDYSVVNRQLRATPQTTGRFQMIKYMLAHINTYHTPFVALAIDPASGIGHYLTVWSINWKSGGTGSTIYYTNTLLTAQSTFNGNIKSTSFTTFLDWMRDNPQASYYNCLFLWGK